VVVIPEAEPEPERLPPVLNLVTGAGAAAGAGGMAGDGLFGGGGSGGGSTGPVPARWPGTGPPFGARPSAFDMAGRSERQVAAIERLAGAGPKRILELGAGAGLRVSPLAERGHSVIAVAGGFADLDLPGPFDVVYYGGFGTGSEDDQHRVLRELSRRVGPEGCVLIEVMTPWAWAAVREQGRGMPPAEHRTVVFDAEASRVRMPLGPMWGETAQTEALRCFGPADLRFLLRGTGLGLDSYEAFAGPGYETAPRLEAATFYLARLTTLA
jgi:SAM-dependent methyltransferase